MNRMNASKPLVAAFALALVAAPSGAIAAGGHGHGRGPMHGPNPRVDRIVGMWQTEVKLFPCEGGPDIASFLALGSFHAGGTLDNTDETPVTSRGPGTGIWKNEGHGQYRARMQFMRYNADGSYDGIQDITRTLRMRHSGRQMDETVVARVLNPDGSLRVTVCGEGTNWRVGLD
jgi:hypothetical protein